jgi:hypothetical protein
MVLSNLNLSRLPLDAELRGALAAMGGGDKVELILAGGTVDLQGKGLDDLTAPARDAVAAGLSVVGQAVRGGRLTVLLAAGEEALAQDEERNKLEKLLGLGKGQVSYAEDLGHGLSGRRLVAGDGVAWVVTARPVDPLAGQSHEDLLSWSGLLGFVKAWTWQLKNRRSLTEPEGPHHHYAQALAQAAVAIAKDKEEQVLLELSRYLDGRGGDPGPGPGAPAPVQALLARAAEVLGDVMVGRVRRQADDGAAAVIVGAAPARYADEEAPLVVFTGDAGGPHPSWVEVNLGGSLLIKLAGSARRQEAPAPVAPAAETGAPAAETGAPAAEAKGPTAGTGAEAAKADRPADRTGDRQEKDASQKEKDSPAAADGTGAGGAAEGGSIKGEGEGRPAKGKRGAKATAEHAIVSSPGPGAGDNQAAAPKDAGKDKNG